MKKIVLSSFLLISSLAVSAQNAPKSYIEKFKDNAISIMHQSGVPASVILAVAMHESACGNSKLAKNLNNQFGVKGEHSVVYISHNKKIRTNYKKYESVLESYNDFARIMTERKQLSKLAEKLTHYDYAGWAHGISKSGYASDRNWESRVLGIIKKYKLDLFDEKPEDEPETAANHQY
jgi:flagellum-specific peptidoglycan hydrolase FlgJ